MRAKQLILGANFVVVELFWVRFHYFKKEFHLCGVKLANFAHSKTME